MKKIIAMVGCIGFFASSVAGVSAAYFDQTLTAHCDTYITNTLQIGSSGSEVYMLQQALLDLGFLRTSPNGYFGPQTASAVRSFQRDNGIRSTGVVGPSTRSVLNGSLCQNIAGEAPTTVSFDQYDPSVRVITPSSANPTVYATPQNFSQEQNSFSGYSSMASQGNYMSPSPVIGVGIVYNPSTGYSIGIVPQSGSITVTSPRANDVYKEGDTVFVQFSTSNLQPAPYSIVLESAISGQSKTVAVISGTSYSFVLTKELLDSVCSGACTNTDNRYCWYYKYTSRRSCSYYR
jgi:peptidoglycan hydrolase-like protein with peptidoglycan-binding domain